MKKRPREVVVLRTAVLNGVRGRVIRKSRATGSLTVQLMGAKGAYAIGSLVNVMPYDCVFTGEKS